MPDNVETLFPGKSHEAKRVNPFIRDFAWALLVAVRLSRQDKSLSVMQEHMYIMKWLSNAKKKKLFHKSTSRELDWFIDEGRCKGYHAALEEKAHYLWTVSTGNISEQSHLRRIHSFFEALKMMGWKDVLVSDSEWLNCCKKSSKVKTIYLRKSELQNNFDTKRNLLSGLNVRLSCEYPGIELLAADSHLTATTFIDEKGFYHAMLNAAED